MTALLLVGLGAALALDGVAAGQFMVSRPLVAGFLTGLVIGDVVTGVAVGAVLEIYLLVAVPSGGGRFPEPGPATVVGVTAAVLAGGADGLALGIAAGLVWGQAGAFSQSVLRHVNGGLVPVPGETSVSPRGVEWAHARALALDATRGALLTAVGVGLAALLVPGAVVLWPLGAQDTRALVLMGALVSLGVLARGEAMAGRRIGIFAAALGGGLLLGGVLS